MLLDDTYMNRLAQELALKMIRMYSAPTVATFSISLHSAELN